MGALQDLDLGQTLPQDEYESLLAERQKRFLELRLRLGRHLDEEGLGPPLLILFEGWDASGKGGCITRLVEPLDPRHYTVHQYAAPSTREKRHHFLWRFWPAIPGRGGLCVFDRSWYGRVLVERVEGFATKHEWQHAYEEIPQWESLLIMEGTILVKFFLHISHEEQERRFLRREKHPLKRWKLSAEDWRNRGKRAEYEAAINDMLEKTHTLLTPWTLVAAECKRFARIQVLEAVIEQVENGLKIDAALKAGKAGK